MFFFFFFKQKTAYEMRISDWSSDVCSSDLMIARILLNDGPAVLTAQKGIYHMDREEVAVPGPVPFQTADGSRLTTRDVDIDVKGRPVKSHGRVDGRLPEIGRASVR